MNENFQRDLLLDELKKTLEKNPKIQAAWVGGSSATGHEDVLSDIDLVVICEDPQQAFQLIEESLNSRHRVLQTWNVEDSPFLGLHQRFYILDQTPETFFVDLGVYKSLNPEDYQEYYNKDRHGMPLVLFDKLRILEKASKNPKLVTPPVLDFANLLARFEVVYRTFQKEALRGKYIDAFLFYQRLVQILVQMMRYKYSPQRFDFGMRYLERDLPKEESELIDELLRISDLETLQFKAPLIKTRLLELQQK